MDTSAEIQRLESNHAELLLHQETLMAQLQTKKSQLKQIRAALGDCRNALERHGANAAAAATTKENTNGDDVSMRE